VLPACNSSRRSRKRPHHSASLHLDIRLSLLEAGGDGEENENNSPGGQPGMLSARQEQQQGALPYKAGVGKLLLVWESSGCGMHYVPPLAATSSSWLVVVWCKAAA
jgi:hypothetical protein